MATNRRSVAAFASLLVVAAALPLLAFILGPAQTGLVPFQSYSELFHYLGRTVGQQIPDYAISPTLRGGLVAGPASPVPPSAGGDFSGTNVQVAGIDELDTVKTDGSHLYLAGDHDVAIVRAVPAANLSVVARVPAVVANDSSVNASTAWVTGVFVVGTHLVVVARGGSYYPIGMYGGILAPIATTPIRAGSFAGYGETLVSLYNIQDPAHPVLEQNDTISGTPVTGRMIAPFIYLVIGQPVIRVNGTYNLPRRCDASGCAILPPQSIYYDPTANEASSYTDVVALDADTGAKTLMSVVTGYTSTVYMSIDALYLTYAKWNAQALGGPSQVAVVSSTDTWTTIHKVGVDGIALNPVAHADVPGTLLNQYSLDEMNGYLRVFTTVAGWTNGSFVVRNNLYVLDETLARAGSLEGIAPGERIHAARFLGDRAYLVTFRSIDPLFAIDLSVETAPRILGELNISGYSDYLYPIDEDHLLGIGQDAANTTVGGFNEPMGLKIALFNVSDATHPVAVSQMVIGDPGTTSDVLRDAKAFLSIPSRGLVVLPVQLALINASQYPQPVAPWGWGQVVWQGAYVLSVNIAGGVGVFGRITHETGTVDPYAGVYLNYSLEIHRSLYIGDDLYTISDAKVKVNALSDLSEVASVVYEPSDAAS